MKRTISFRRDQSVKWSDINPVLQLQEIGVELDTRLFKVGDGTTAWNALVYNPEKMPKPMVAEFFIYTAGVNMLKDVPFKWPWSKK